MHRLIGFGGNTCPPTSGNAAWSQDKSQSRRLWKADMLVCSNTLSTPFSSAMTRGGGAGHSQPLRICRDQLHA